MVAGIRGEAGMTPAKGACRRTLGNPPAWAVIAACAAVLGLRRAHAWSNPQFWAEDGVFYARAMTEGTHAFLDPMGGYLHTILRAVALLAAHVDPVFAPAVFVGAATLATLYVCSLTLSQRCPLPRLSGLCALAVVLVPETHEVLLNLVNLQWVLGAGLILILLSADPVRPGAWFHDTVVVAAMGLTGPFCIILAPLFLLRALQRRSRASAVLSAIVVACSCVQAFMLWRNPPTVFDANPSYVSYRFILPIIGRRVGGSLLLGDFLRPDTDIVIGSIAGLFTLCAVAYLAFRPGQDRTARIGLGLAFALVLAGSLYRASNGLYLFFTPETRARYVYIPQLLALWLLLLGTARPGRLARICSLLCIWALLVNLPRLREPAYKNLHWADYADRIRAGAAVSVPINPQGFTVELPARPK
jgi:hypothetical protein